MRGAQRRQRTARIVVVGLLLALFHATQPIWAQPPATPSPERSLEGLGPDPLLMFADHLLHEGEYFRAITEYRRGVFNKTAVTRAPRAVFSKRPAFFFGGIYY